MVRQRLLEAILASATDYAIVAMDLDGLVTVWNAGAERILGWTEAEMLGKPGAIFFTPEDREDGVPHREMEAAIKCGRGSDERWHLRKDGSRFWASGEMLPLLDELKTPLGFLKVLRDRTEQRLSEERQRLLMGELAHRVKNTLAVVQAIAGQTLRGAGSLAEAREAFNSRMMAISRAHDTLMQGSWTEASLRTLVEGAALVHGGEQAARFDIQGHDVTLGPKAALSFALVLHEMGTNAIKYGALSNDEGRVHINWSVHEGALRFVWEEMGGPPVVPVTREGFGTRLIAHSFGADTNLKVSYPPTGAVLTLDASMTSLQKT